jgi:hypothetical protein
VKRAAPVLILLVAAVGCGSSSSGGSNGTTTTAAANNRSQIAACMRKQGVNFPDRPRGATGPTGPRGPGGGGAGGFLFGGGGGGNGGPGRFQSDPKFQAAAKKCGLNFNRRANGQGGGFAGNPRFKQAIDKFVACVRKNGYRLPAANFSGNGPVFDASKVNRNDPKFVKAAQKCQSLLSFGRGATGPGGPPPPQ